MKQDAKKIIKIVSISALFLFIIVFAFFRSKDLIFGVKIRNLNLVNGEKFTGSILPITGNARNAVEITIDGREISVDQSGNFNETIVLLSGYNVVDIYAKDKFGHNDEKVYKLMYVSP